MRYKELYRRLYTYVDSTSKNHRFEIYWDRNKDRITEKMCKFYIENIIRDKPDLNPELAGWNHFEKWHNNLEFSSPEELDVKLTLMGY